MPFIELEFCHNESDLKAMCCEMMVVTKYKFYFTQRDLLLFVGFNISKILRALFPQ